MKNLKIRSQLVREIFAEFLGTFILMVFGNGSVAQTVLSGGKHGSYFAINWGFGVGVMLGVYVSGGISGGHLNPAVTLALSVTNKFPLKKVLPYFLGQYLGAFFASVVVYFVYWDALQIFTGGNLSVVGENATAGIWATYPSEGISNGIGFVDQIVGTALLLICIRALTDERNMAVPGYLVPFLVGLVVLNIGIAFGHNCGYAINPARDFAPRLFTLMAGFGTDTFSAFNYWFYVPILAPHLGAILGSILYEVLVNFHWPQIDGETDLTLVNAEHTNKMDSISINHKEGKSSNN